MSGAEIFRPDRLLEDRGDSLAGRSSSDGALAKRQYATSDCLLSETDAPGRIVGIRRQHDGEDA
jgi:hypothetical protein